MLKHRSVTGLLAAIAMMTVADVQASAFSDASEKGAVRAENLTPITRSEHWKLIWSDEFSASQLDMDKWSFEKNCWGGGNNEQQCYTDRPQNLYIDDGILNITAIRGAFKGPVRHDDRPDYRTAGERELPYTSARIRSKGKGDWLHGRFEIRAKLPTGQGTWPAIWMLPTDSPYDWWAASGEIDILEAVNLKARSDEHGTLGSEPESRVHGTLHYGRRWPDNVHTGTGFKLPEGEHPSDAFYTYAIEWEKDEIRWYVDDYHFATQRSSGWYSQSKSGDGWETNPEDAPFDHPFHLIMNLAVGGNWPAKVNETGIDESVFPQTLQIDFVRVYQCERDPATGKGCAAIDPKAKRVRGISGPKD